MTKNKPAKITNADKAIIKIMVSNLHVATSDKEVEKFLRAKIKGANTALISQAIAYALKVHKQNQNLYNTVMGPR